MHVKAKDTVLVLSGKSEGHRGQVLSVDSDTGRAIVEGVNVVKKHERPNPKLGTQGGIIEREAPVDVSNLMLVCPKCSAPTRPRSERLPDGHRVRACRRCGAHVDK